MISIADFLIQRDGRPFIIVEAGINHNGDLTRAFEMIALAKQAGADAVKFQTFKAEEFIADKTLTYTYQSQGRSVTESMFTMFKRYEFSDDSWIKIKKECDDSGILFLSTPQNYTDLQVLLELGVPAIKVGSDDFTNIPLLKQYASTQLPLILSSGMADLGDVFKALEAVGTFDGYPTVLLVCTSQYPAELKNAHLLKIKTLRNMFPGLPIGFSDHTQGSLAASVAVGLGAVVFEKHFTLSHDLPGPDHWFSANPEELKKWVQDIRQAYIALGSPVVRPSEPEKSMRLLARRSLVVAESVKAGDVVSAKNLILKRPGTGIAPENFENMLGKKFTKNLLAGAVLAWSEVE